MLSLPSLDPAIANAAFIELRACLTWMFDSTEPDMLARGRYALASIEDLRPASAYQARLAARAVAADIYAGDAMRLAWEHREDLKRSMQCRAQANAMMRHADRAQARLEACQRGRCMEGAVTAARRCLPPPADTRPPHTDTLPPLPDLRPLAAPTRVIEATPAATRAIEATPAASCPTNPPPQTTVAPEPAPPAASPAPDAPAPLTPTALAKAERYVKQNRLLAMRIRRAGALTQKSVAGFRPAAYPQDQETLQALLHGSSPILAALDSTGRQERAAA